MMSGGATYSPFSKMFGKLCLLTVVLLSLVQVWGDQGGDREKETEKSLSMAEGNTELDRKEADELNVLSYKKLFRNQKTDPELEDAIRKGLELVRSRKIAFESSIYNISRRIWPMETSIKSNTTRYQSKARGEKNNAQLRLSVMATILRLEARNQTKPNAVFECIERVEFEGITTLENDTKKFCHALLEAEQDSLEEIRDVVKDLEILEEHVMNEHDKMCESIRSSRSTGEVDMNLSIYSSKCRDFESAISTIDYKADKPLYGYLNRLRSLNENYYIRLKRVTYGTIRLLIDCMKLV